MHKSQANRARIAARIIAAPIPPKPRPDLPKHLQVTTGPVRRTRALPMTGAQRDSTGSRSDWSRSASIGGSLRPVIVDRRWSDTVTQVA